MIELVMLDGDDQNRGVTGRRGGGFLSVDPSSAMKETRRERAEEDAVVVICLGSYH